MKLVEKRPPGHDSKHTGDMHEPWFTRGAIGWLEKNLNKNMVVMEYGCGTSTEWYANRVKHLVSIEHDKNWFDRVYKYLRFKNVKNVDIRCIDICSGYIEAIDKMGNFDLVCIDGRRRHECIKHSHTHVKTNGYLLLDNAERDRYQKAIKDYLVDGWKRLDFHNNIWLTSIFQRI